MIVEKNLVRLMSVVVWFAVLGFPSTVNAQVLDEVEVGLRRDGSAGIRINFSTTVQVLRAVPKSSGKTVYISLRLTGAETGTRPASERATNFGNLDGRLPLSDVTLELNGAEGDRLIVSFSRTTQYKVFQGRDGRSVLLVVPPDGLNKAHPVPADELPPEPQAPGFTGPLTGKMALARQFLIQGKNDQAIELFQEIVRAPNHKDTQDANELLGLAYERDHQLGKARDQYRRYLKLYPKGPGADRVQQRLRNLVKVSGQPTLKSSRSSGPDGKTLLYGTLAQRAYAGVSNSATGSTVDQTTLISNFNMTARKRTETADYKAAFSADNTYDFLNNASTSRVLTAYVEGKSKWYDVSGKFGRQRGRGAGVLDRFDGALIGGNFYPKWRLNYVAGVPVDIWASGSKRDFSGISLDAGTFAGKWSTTLFKIDSVVDGRPDRQAIGTEVRYFNKGTAVFSMVDYDTYFNELNVAMAQANWKAKNDWSYNFLVDSRKAPYLQVSNSLLAPVNGVVYDSIAALAAAEPAIDLVQLAKDRTATSQTVAFGLNLPNLKQFGVKNKFLQKFQFGGDLLHSTISGLPASAGQPATASSETSTVTVRAIATELFAKNEISVAGISIIDGATYQGLSVYLTERNRLKKDWRLDTGLKLYHQDNSSGTSLNRITPSVRAEYRRKKATFEFELGRETSQSINPLQNENIDRDFVTIGYRYDF